jgi:2Fe-2S ferredoxin
VVWTVRVEPLGASLDVLDGETLMGAAERLGYRWPTVCHGQALCTLCAVDVGDGPDAFEPPRPRELAGLQLFAGRTFYEGKLMRLACQARPIAHAVVTKRGVRRVNDPEGER